MDPVFPCKIIEPIPHTGAARLIRRDMNWKLAKEYFKDATLEIVYTDDPNVIMLIDEDGIAKDLPRNFPAADFMAKRYREVTNCIMGPAILCPNEMVK
jgi:hypothetical protein